MALITATHETRAWVLVNVKGGMTSRSWRLYRQRCCPLPRR